MTEILFLESSSTFGFREELRVEILIWTMGLGYLSI